MSDEENKEITLAMIRDISKIEDGEYLISYSSEFSETPEYDTITLEEARKIFEGTNLTQEEFEYNIVPYLDSKEAETLFLELITPLPEPVIDSTLDTEDILSENTMKP